MRSTRLPPIELLSAVHTEFNVHSSTEADGGISRLPTIPHRTWRAFYFTCLSMELFGGDALLSGAGETEELDGCIE